MITLKSIVRHWSEEQKESVALTQPTLAEMAVNFADAMRRLAAYAAANGVTESFVPREVFEARLAVCRGCDFWNENARLGLGLCKHSGCGCTVLKLWLPSEKCKAG